MRIIEGTAQECAEYVTAIGAKVGAPAPAKEHAATARPEYAKPENVPTADPTPKVGKARKSTGKAHGVDANGRPTHTAARKALHITRAALKANANGERAAVAAYIASGGTGKAAPAPAKVTPAKSAKKAAAKVTGKTPAKGTKRDPFAFKALGVRMANLRNVPVYYRDGDNVVQVSPQPKALRDKHAAK
jgi:hypothetical protein